MVTGPGARSATEQDSGPLRLTKASSRFDETSLTPGDHTISAAQNDLNGGSHFEKSLGKK